jgi:hypothetical protein
VVGVRTPQGPRGEAMAPLLLPPFPKSYEV